MAVPSPQLQQLLELGSRHMRLLAYMVAVSIFASGVYTGMYHPRITALIPLTLVLAYGQSWLHRRLSNRIPSQATSITLLLDGLITGFGIASIHYALVPMLVFIAMLNASALSFGNLFLWVFTGFFCLFGSLLGGMIFGLEAGVIDNTPTAVNVVALIGSAFYFGLTAFRSREQSRALINAQALAFNMAINTSIGTRA